MVRLKSCMPSSTHMFVQRCNEDYLPPCKCTIPDNICSSAKCDMHK